MHTQISAKRQSIWRRPLSRKTWIILALVVLIITGWTRGTFDNFLWKVGLNYNECATNGFGATFCGDALKEYQLRINNLDR